jgi:hypothetical protein
MYSSPSATERHNLMVTITALFSGDFGTECQSDDFTQYLPENAGR